MEQDTEFYSEEEKIVEGASKYLRRLATVFTGNILVGQGARGLFGYGIKLFFVILVYMTNSYSMNSRYRESLQLKRDINTLRTMSVTLSSEVMNATRQSEISRELKSRGINISSSRTPHKVLE